MFSICTYIIYLYAYIYMYITYTYIIMGMFTALPVSPDGFVRPMVKYQWIYY